MKRWTKNLLVSFATLFTTATIATTIAIPLSLNKNSLNDNKKMQLMSDQDWANEAPFEFNNKTYLNLNDAYNDFVNDIGGIKINQFIGKINNKNEDGSIILANNPIEPFMPSKISNAYMDANGRYTNDYDVALKSFINAANLVTQYYDYKGNYFLDEEDAKYSMDNFKSMGLAYYQVEDYMGNVHKINPLNNDDINFLKKIAIQSILKNPKKEDNPFKFKIVGKSLNENNNYVYDKKNEVIYDIIGEWINLCNVELAKNIKNALVPYIKEYLRNNNCIKVNLYIKPWITPHNSDFKGVDEEISINLNKPLERRYGWYFDFNGEHKLNIETKKLNYDNFINFAKVFMDRNTFTNYFKIEYTGVRVDGAGFQPTVEYANGKDNLTSFFNNKFNIGFDKVYQPPINSLSDANHKTVAKILTKSDEYDNWWDAGPKYKNNYMLTFGIEPYIPNDESLKLRDYLRNCILSNKIDFNKLLSNTIFSSNGKYELLKKFFSQFLIKDQKNENRLDLNLTLDEKSIDLIKDPNKKTGYNNVVNIFNQNAIQNAKMGNVNENTTMYNDLQERIGKINGNEELHIINQAIDYRQWIYATTSNEKEKKEVKANDYLGFNSEEDETFFNKFLNLSDQSIINIEFNNKSINVSNTIDNFSKFLENFEYIITYNDMPLFKINKNSDFINNNNFKLLIDSVFNNSEMPKDNSSYFDETNYINLLDNISTSYYLQPIENQLKLSNNYIYDNSKNIKYNNNQDLEITIKNIDNYNLKPTWNYFPSNNLDPTPMKNGIYDAISLYNQNVKSLASNETNKQILYKNKPNNFLMLFDKLGSEFVVPSNMYYAETVSGVDNINLSLTNAQSNNMVAYNYKQLESLQKRLSIFSTPAKVYFIYSGANLISTKPITEQDAIKINPDFFDSPELVIENALRSYWLKPDNEYVMYKEENYYKTLLNNIFILYSFELNNKIYYFDSYINVENKIIEYIKFNSYKI